MATEQKIHGELTQIDENGTVTVMYPHTTVDDITGVLPVEKGGTGCNSTSDLLFNLSFKSPIDYLNSIEDEYIDLNNLTAAEHCGYWYFGVNYRPNNSPDPENTGYLFVVRGGGATGTVRKQIWMNQSGEQSTYTRTYTGTEWTPWVKLAIENDKLLTNQDLNNVKTDGVYYAKGNNTVSNKPNGVPASFGLTVIRTANNYYVQLYYTPTNMVYRRYYDGTNDTWSEWVKDDNVKTTYNVMTGATSSSDGSSGLVPAPTTNDINSYLRGDGTWNNPTDAKLLTNEDLNDVKTNGIYYAKGNNTVSNKPNGVPAAFGLEVIRTSVNYYIQLYYTPSNLVYRRWYHGANDIWSEWVKDDNVMTGATSSSDGSSGLVPAPSSDKESSYLRGDGTWSSPLQPVLLENNTDLNDIKTYGTYYSVSSLNINNKPTNAYDNTISSAFGLEVIRTANAYYTQLLYTIDSVIYKRYFDGNDWSSWSTLNQPTLLTYDTDLNNIKTCGIYYSTRKRANGETTDFIVNRPTGVTDAFGLEVIRTANNYYTQILNTAKNSVYRRYYDGTNDTWSEWVKDNNVMTGATSSSDGSSGLVPAPTTNDINSYLRGDGTWNNPTDAKLLTNEDLNDVKTNGIYYAKGNNTVSNKPDGVPAAFGLTVIRTSVNYYIQLYYTPSNLVYRRWYHGANDIWSEWVEDKLTDNDTWTKVSTTSDGYINKLSGNTTEWLSGDGTWSTPTASDIGALPSSTTYALSSTSGGAAISANRLTNPVNINGVSFDGSCDISINDRRVAIVGNDSSSDNSVGWYKVADGTLTGYANTSLLFAVTGLFAVDDLEETYTLTIDDPESYYMSGILQLDIRSMVGILTVNNFGWLTRTNNLPLNSFKVKITNDKWTLYYNVKQLYCRVFFEVIEESGTNTVNASYTLYSNQTKETATPIEAVTSVDLYIPISSSTTIGDRSVSIAGSTNDILSKDSGILGGSSNTINGSSYSKYSCIIGGDTNTIDPENKDNSNGDVIIGGAHNETSGYYNITSGYYNTNSGMSTFVCGKYNDSATPSSGVNSNDGDAFVIGNGTSTTDRSNAFRVEYNGTIYAGNSTIQSGADYAEFIKPWADGNPDNEDRVGYMVTIKDGYLYKANDGDYIIGITSGNPSVVGNGDENYYWKYERDEFNRIIYEDVEELIETTDNDGNVVFIKSGNIIKNARPKISENYDSSLQDSYIERSKRPEWDYVGMRGIVPVRDDGTCITGGFCKCGTDGIATKSDTQGFNTYYVIERINNHVISVEVK